MRIRDFLLAGLAFLSPVLAQDDEDPDPPAPTPSGIDAFANVTLYQPDDSTTQVTSARTASLKNGTVLSAWNDPSNKGTIQVYRSTNSAYSWYTFGNATSDSKKTLLQPHLLYIDGEFAGDSDTILLAVNAVDAKSTAIELYASYDKGESFELVSQIATGGPISNASAAVMNPFLYRNGNALSVFYTGKGDKNHAQKVVQQSTTDDYDSWGRANDVVISSSPSDRPAAPSITKIGNTKNYILAFQYGLTDAATNTTTYPIYYKITSNPQNAAADQIRDIHTDTGVVPSGEPSVTWSPLGGANGTLVLSDSMSSSVFVNQALGEGEWWELGTTAGRAQGREVAIPPNDATKIRFASGAEVNGRGASQVLITVMNLEKALASLTARK